MKTLLLVALCVAVAAAASSFTMSIRKQMPNGKEILLRRANQKAMPSKGFVNRLVSGSQPFIDYVDNFYLGDITLGTKGQLFQIVLDTGSSNLWVVDTSCTADVCDGLSNPLFDPWKKHKYDRSKSSTYEDDGRYFEIYYGSGSCNGKLVRDDLNFAGLTVKNVTFGAASEIAEVFGYFPVDGIFGLGWPSIAVDDVVPPFQMLMPQLDKDKQLFTVWLDRHVKPSEGQNGGQITYGDYDSKNCEADTTYTPITSKSYWEFKIDGFSVGKYTNSKKAVAISDTGTSFIYGPYSDVQQIISQSGAQFDFSSGLYVVDCDGAKDLPDVVYKIGGKDLKIPGSEHVVDLELGDNQCALGFDFSDGFPFDWLLGDGFIRSYCNIYDVGKSRIGFAKALHKEV